MTFQLLEPGALTLRIHILSRTHTRQSSKQKKEVGLLFSFAVGKTANSLGQGQAWGAQHRHTAREQVVNSSLARVGLCHRHVLLMTVMQAGRRHWCALCFTPFSSIGM